MRGFAVLAKNHAGWEVQRHYGAAGWLAIPAGECPTRHEANELYKCLMFLKRPDREYRVYESLTTKGKP